MHSSSNDAHAYLSTFRVNCFSTR